MGEDHWLADVLARIVETPRTRLDELLSWNWDAARQRRLDCDLHLSAPDPGRTAQIGCGPRRMLTEAPV